MKKVIYPIIILFGIALMVSCKSHQRCAAYSYVPQDNVQKPM